MIDVDHLIELLDALQVVVLARRQGGVLEPDGQRGPQDVVDERALAGAGDAGDAGEAGEGDGDVEVLEIVLAGAADD